MPMRVRSVAFSGAAIVACLISFPQVEAAPPLLSGTDLEEVERHAVGGHVPEEATLVPIPLLTADEIDARLESAHSAGERGIPLAEAYAPVRRPLSTIRDLCVYVVNGDYVHVTKNEASGHGWWLKGTCPRSTRANVRIELVENLYGHEYLVASGELRGVPAWDARGKKANARSQCVRHDETKWHSLIHVDLVGRIEPPMGTYTRTRPLPCQ
jgi:hypothetical protein